MKTTNMTVIYDKEVLGRGFKIYGTEENPLFLAKDVAEWIDYAYKDKAKGTRNVNMMLQAIDEDEKLVARLFTSGQRREMWFLTEDGLYEVLMQSRKPIAKAFKKEVKTILKQIRQTGGYIPLTEQDDELTIMSKALMIAQNTLVRKDELIVQKDVRINTLTHELEETLTENEALRGKFFSKDDVTKIVMLVRRYGGKVGFDVAWNDFYRELYYNFGISLRKRRGKTLRDKFRTEEEIANGIKCIVSLCGARKIKTSDILAR